MTAEEVKRFKFKEGFCLLEMRKDAEQSAGGIYFADRYKPWQPDGVVVNMTPLKHDAPGFEVGDRVICQPVHGRVFDCDGGERLVLMRQQDIMAVWE